MKEKIRKIIPYSIRKKYVDYKNSKKVNIYRKKYKKINADKKVSVVVPNYNYSRFLEERIDSILLQSYPIYELIILDDASTDNSIEVIDRALAKYDLSNIKVVKDYNKKNGGSVFSQWQKGFKIASGDYVWMAEADDSSHPTFLENVMKGFDNEKVVLSYAESMRINENNNIIKSNCRDWMEAISKDKWNKSYVNDGKDEIRNSLSICNSIPNVSAVVFKKQDQIELIEEAKQYKISGDWYLYYKLLLNGDVAYCAKSLNYFRKHSTSASTVAKKEIELEEVLKLQYEIRNTVKLNSEQIHRQSFRYGGIINEVSKNKIKELDRYFAKKIAWIIPAPIKGSGGIRTMIQNANYLVDRGYEVDIYVEEDFVNTNESLKMRLINYYGECKCNVFVGVEMRQNYDLIFATYSIKTADYVRTLNIPKKAYFIQDFEPWFEAMGGLYLDMEKTYKYGLEGISIGNWLANKISTEFNASMHSFNFCADLNVYKKIDVDKEDAICFIYQPEKARRCSDMGLAALKLVKKLRPEVKIYLYGSDTKDISPIEFENLGIVNIEKCNELYNKCKVGLCISASNPSRIPFEMMASGLPVVDIYRENNLYDDPDAGVLLADSTPEAIATAILKIYDDKKLQASMSTAGSKFMKNYPLEKGFEQFGEFVDNYLYGNLKEETKYNKIYNKKAIYPSDEVMKVNGIIAVTPMPIKNTSKSVRNMVRIKKGIIRRIKEMIKKLFRV